MLKRLSLILVVIALALIGFIWYLQRGQAPQADSSQTVLKEQVVDEVLISTDLDLSHLERLVSSLKTNLQEDFWPRELVLSEVPGPSEEKAYVANWQIAGQTLSVLYVILRDGDKFKYLRLWGLAENEPINLNRYQELVTSLFGQELISQVKAICATGEILSRSVSRCGGLASGAEENLVGLTVQAPVFIDNLNQDKTTISACLVSSEGKNSYAENYCL